MVMRSVLWSAAAMAVTAVTLSFVVTGALGEGTRGVIESVPGIFRVGKAAWNGKAAISAGVGVMA